MTLIENVIATIEKSYPQLSITAILILLFLILRSILLKIVKKHSQINDLDYTREVYIKKLISMGLILVFTSAIGMVWEISVKGLSIYFASIFTVIGVGLFANWSILSNLTASVILFFFFPYRIGRDIKIVDGDNSIEGTVVDITLFYIKIEAKDKQFYSYPNNLAIQKPIVQSS